MTLVSCYIAAFGGIKDREIVFRDGITEILEKNGAGKSTLAGFLKAMLYGLSGVGKKTIDDNEVKLYTPFEGGRFGGSLTFVERGREYRIERYFEKKDETVRVIDTTSGEETSIFGQEVGLALFGVDADSFMRTVYETPRHLPKGGTAPLGITAKLNDLVGEVFDLGRFAEADRILDAERTAIKLRRGSGGRLYEAEEHLRTLTGTIREAEDSEAAAIRSEEIAAERAIEIEKLRPLYEEAKEALIAAEQKAGEERHREGLRVATAAKLGREEARCREIGRHFPNGMPSGEVIAVLTAKGAERRALRAGLTATAAASRPLPSDEEIAATRSALRKKEETQSKICKINEMGQESIAKDGWFIPLLAALGVLLAGGIITAVFALAVGLALTGVALLGALVLWLVEGTRQTKARARVEKAAATREAERAALTVALSAAEDGIRRFMTAYGRGEPDAESLLAALGEAIAVERHRREDRARLEARYAALDAEIAAALAAFRDLPREAESALARITELATEWRAAERAAEEWRRELDALSAPVHEENEKENLLALRLAAGTLRTEIERATEAMATAKANADSYRRASFVLEEARDDYAATEERIARLSHRVKILDTARLLLTDAKQELEERHLAGVRESFADYLSVLLPTEGREFTVERDLGISFTERGERHSGGYLSAGMQAMADICLRLALSDRLYPTSPPPLILDDPFVMLDGENLRAARELLLRLSEGRQILYMTCHPSRSLTGESE